MWQRESYSCPNSLQHTQRLVGLLIASAAKAGLSAARRKPLSLRINTILTVSMFEDNIQTYKT